MSAPSARKDELLAELADLEVDLSRFADLMEQRELTAGEDERARNVMKGIERRKLELAAIESREARVDTVRRAAGNPTNRLSGDGATAGRVAPIPGMRSGGDPWEANRNSGGIFARTNPGEIHERAYEAIEHAIPADHMTDAQRQRGIELIEQDDDRHGIAKWVVATSDPAYRSAFLKTIKNPHGAHLQWTDSERAAMAVAENQRAAMSLTGANGGFMVPFTLDPSIILTNDGAVNPMRQLATVKTIATDDWNGITSAGVTAEWLAEASQAADASPTIAQPSITAHKAAAYIQASFEVAADAALANDIGMLIADAKDRLEATAHVSGSGSGQPYGIVTELQLVTASRVAGSSGAAGAADFVVADIYAVDNALPARHHQRAAWLAQKTTYNRIRQFATGSGPQNAFWTDLGGGQPSLLLGYPTHEASAMDNTIVSGSNDDCLILGDFKAGYYVIDRVGTTIVFEPLIKGANARPTGEVGWFAYWRTGGRAVNPNAFRMLRL